MNESKFPLPDCPLEYAANIISGKWKIRLLWILYKSECVRFNELKRQLNGITVFSCRLQGKRAKKTKDMIKELANND